MRALVDTMAFLWWVSGDPRLSDPAKMMIADPANPIFLSVASAWEIAIKYGRGRLVLPEPPVSFVPSRLASQHMHALPVRLAHALHVGKLPNLHKDPFDRMLVAQSQIEGIAIITADPDIPRYDVEIIW